jgi:hypothetical protein
VLKVRIGPAQEEHPQQLTLAFLYVGMASGMAMSNVTMEELPIMMAARVLAPLNQGILAIVLILPSVLQIVETVRRNLGRFVMMAM